jgi:hypothetical protein
MLHRSLFPEHNNHKHDADVFVPIFAQFARIADIPMGLDLYIGVADADSKHASSPATSITIDEGDALEIVCDNPKYLPYTTTMVPTTAPTSCYPDVLPQDSETITFAHNSKLECAVLTRFNQRNFDTPLPPKWFPYAHTTITRTS